MVDFQKLLGKATAAPPSDPIQIFNNLDKESGKEYLRPAQKAVLRKWYREAEREPTLRELFTRMVEYRRHVLAIFEALLNTESRFQRVQ